MDTKLEQEKKDYLEDWKNRRRISEEETAAEAIRLKIEKQKAREEFGATGHDRAIISTEEPTIEEKVIEDKKGFIEKVKDIVKKPKDLPPPPKLPPEPEPVDTTEVEVILEETIEKIIEDDTIIAEIPPLPEEPPQEEPKVEEVLDAQEQLREAVVNAKAQLNDNIGELAKIKQEWIDEYKTETGKNAIWNGKVTAGFKDFCLNVLGKEL